MFATLTRAAGVFFFLLTCPFEKKDMCLSFFVCFFVNIWSILVNIRTYLPTFVPVWVSMCVRKRLFSGVLCRTAAARAARVIRRARQARSEGNVEARSGFGVVNNGFNSLSSFLPENQHSAVCGHFPGPFVTRFRPVLTVRTHPGDLGSRAWFSASEKEAGPAMGGLNCTSAPGLRDQLYIGIYRCMYVHTCAHIYVYIYIYMSWGPGFTAPPKGGGSPRMGSPSEWNMHAMHAYACIHRFA